MSKVAIITDTHFGIRSDASLFLDYQRKFYDNIFFPTLQQHDIKTVIHMGDLVDRRKYVNYNTSMVMKTIFLNKLGNYDCHFIAGNHDTYHKNSNDLNCYEQLIKGVYPYKFYTETTNIEIEGKPLLFVPWINSENWERSFQMIESSPAELLFGHLEISGFEMNRGVVCDHGIDTNIFAKYSFVFTGHFHQKSNKHNIFYLGAPYQMTWADYNCPRGFHLFDLSSKQLEFIVNPYQMFQRLVYNDYGCKKLDDLLKRYDDLNMVENSYCKIVVAEKNRPLLFDQFINEIERHRPFDLKVVEQDQISIQEQSIDLNCEDTLTIINKTIDGSDIVCDKNQLKQIMVGLYNRSQELELQ